MQSIITLKQELTQDKGARETQETNMKEAEKTITTKVKTLRHKEMTTKHAELDEKHKNANVGGKEEELRAQKKKLEEVHFKAADKLARTSKKLKVADELVAKHKDKENGYKSKEMGTKTDIAANEKRAKDATQQDIKAREAAMKANQIKADADKRRDMSLATRNKAIDDEKKSKNDAMERTKKQEASGIQRAVEKKNKAQEVSEKAFESRAELREKQLVRAKESHSKVVKSMDKFITEKQEVSKEHSLPDLFSVKAMEEKNEEAVNSAEKAQKISLKHQEMTQDKATETDKAISEKKIKLDNAHADEKKKQDLLDSSERSLEVKIKANSLAKTPQDKKASKQEMHDAEADKRHWGFEEKDAKGVVKARNQEKETLVTREATTKKEAVDATNEKISADQDSTVAQRQQETGSKVAERFRTLTGVIAEREEKRKTSALSVAEDEKNYKLADDKAKAESAKCKKLKAADANVGKAYEALKQQMAEWSNKNPWLKQEEAEGRDDAGDPDVGASLEEQAPVPTETSYEMEDLEPPPFARRSFMQLLQEDYGTDVKGLLST